MERFLLINNKNFFDKHNIHTINTESDIPNYNSILFIGSHRESSKINDIKKQFNNISKKPFTYIIIAGKGNGILSKNIIIPNNIKYIFATHTNYVHDKIKFLPLGSDFRSISSFSNGNINNTNRDILCYCNFSLNTHSDRRKIHNKMKHKNFVTIENMQSFLSYSISRDEFFKKLSRSKFVICPRGINLDSYRFYDTIYSGAIPIVVKEQFHNLPFFHEVPILYLKNANEYNDLTEEFLNKKYDELIKYKKNYYEKLDFNNFINELNSYK